MAARHLVLPERGVAIVGTDVHGNLEDLRRLEERFRAEDDAHLVVLGDVVHGPDAGARRGRPELYDYDDHSMEVVDRLRELQGADPARVHFVLGNHDHGHVGGPHTQKFHGDEVEALELTLGEAQRRRLRAFLADALFAVAAPCGVLLTHGSPDDTLTDLASLDDVPLDVARMTGPQARTMRSLLTSYGQPDDVAARMLANVSRGLGFDVRVVVHGHDRDEAGFFREGRTQVCPVIFGAPRHAKRYVRLDLAARYESADDLREGVEILRLWD